MGLKDDILNSTIVNLEPVDAFGTTVYVKQLAVGDVADLERKLIALDDSASSTDADILAVAHALCDENGERVFSDTELDQLAALNRCDFRRVVAVFQRLNKITDEQVQETAKN